MPRQPGKADENGHAPHYHDERCPDSCTLKGQYTFVICLGPACKILLPWPSPRTGVGAYYCDRHRPHDGPNATPEDIDEAFIEALIRRDTPFNRQLVADRASRRLPGARNSLVEQDALIKAFAASLRRPPSRGED